MASSTLQSAQESRIKALQNKHEALSQRVREAQKSPSMAGTTLRTLKKQKLMIKEQIEGIRASG